MSETAHDAGFLESLPKERQEQMASILNLSHTMLDTARAEDWDTLAQQETLRRSLITEFFSEKSTVETATVIEQSIHMILAVDKEILALSEKAKSSFGEQVHRLVTGQKASKAYLQNSR